MSFHSVDGLTGGLASGDRRCCLACRHAHAGLQDPPGDRESTGLRTVPLLNAVRALIHGGDIYTSKGAFDFLYPPSALAMSLPLGLVPVDTPRWLFSLRISSASSSHQRSSFASSISR